MIKRTIASAVLVFFVSLGLSAQRCGAVQPAIDLLADQQEALSFRGLITIPVVVHVVFKNSEEEVSLAQIESQIDVLNQDYNALNDLSFIPNEFEDAVSSTGITFCLAQRDPNGSPTNGITYSETTVDNIGIKTNVFYTLEGGIDAWNPAHYLNIWVADMGENQTGRASFPGVGIPAEDGVIIDPRYFGDIEKAASSQPYHLGRTTTHEVGHYFNLFHVWGPDPISCDKDDAVADTPLSAQTYLMECPSESAESCGSMDMFTNFMNYTNDACMGQFTPGQCNRVRASILSLRPELLNSLACVSPEVVVNTAQFDFTISSNPNNGQFKIKLNQFPGNNIRLELFDFRGQYLWTDQCSFQTLIEIQLPGHIRSGAYLLRVSSNELQQTKKIILIP